MRKRTDSDEERKENENEVGRNLSTVVDPNGIPVGPHRAPMRPQWDPFGPMSAPQGSHFGDLASGSRPTGRLRIARHIMPRHATPCHATPCHIQRHTHTLCHATPHHTHTMPFGSRILSRRNRVGKLVSNVCESVTHFHKPTARRQDALLTKANMNSGPLCLSHWTKDKGTEDSTRRILPEKSVGVAPCMAVGLDPIRVHVCMCVRMCACVSVCVCVHACACVHMWRLVYALCTTHYAVHPVGLLVPLAQGCESVAQFKRLTVALSVRPIVQRTEGQRTA